MSKHRNSQDILKEHTGLVHSIALKFKGSKVPYEDLVQEGMIGLWEAQQKFDPNRGTQFSSYAYFWIKKRILSAVKHEKSDSMDSIKLTEETTEAKQVSSKSENLILPNNVPELEKAILKLHFEKEYTLREIATELKMSRERVRQLREKALRRLRVTKEIG